MNQKEEKEDEEIQMENVDSESDLENKVIPENYRSQHDMLAGGAPELNEISDFDYIWAPRQSNNNKSNTGIIEILDNREEIEILYDHFDFNGMSFIPYYSTCFHYLNISNKGPFFFLFFL